MQIIYNAEILVEIREDQHGQLQPAAVHLQLCFLQIAPLLLKLDLGLDHVRVRHFTALLELLADVQEPLCFCGGALGRGILQLRHHESVVGPHHSHDQPTRSNFRAGLRHRLGG